MSDLFVLAAAAAAALVLFLVLVKVVVVVHWVFNVLSFRWVLHIF